MEGCSSVDTPSSPGIKLIKEDGQPKVDAQAYRSLIGSLLYLCATRPDISFTVNLLSRFMQSPSEIHLRSAKRVLRYIQGTLDLGILYSRGTTHLVGYSDADWAGSDEEMRSISGSCFTLGSGVITWFSKKQTVVAQSTAEAEYVALAKCANQAVWLRKVMADLMVPQTSPTTIFCDNKAAIAIVKNPVLHDRTKHFKIKFHAIRQLQLEGEIEVDFCNTDDQVADIFTKSFTRVRFEKLR